jgi:hypothetical protein
MKFEGTPLDGRLTSFSGGVLSLLARAPSQWRSFLKLILDPQIKASEYQASLKPFTYIQ